MSPRTRFQLRRADDWRGTITLALYRFGVAVMLVATSNLADSAFGQAARAPGLFRVFCWLYLAATTAQAAWALARRTGYQRQTLFQILVDGLALSAIAYVGSGLSHGLPMLLIPSLAAGGVMLSPTVAFVLAGLASLAMLGQAVIRAAYDSAAENDLLQVGLLCLLYGLSTALAVHLARRLAASDAAAASLVDHSRDLSEINRHILNRMQIGALVIDRHGRLQTLNRAAGRLLEVGEDDDPSGRHLQALCPNLAALITRWRRDGHVPSVFENRGRSLLPTIQPLHDRAERHGMPTLVFLEDARRASEQAQQIKLVSLGRLSASIAHEIRNPLAAITHAAQLLRESEQRDAQDERLVSIIGTHARRIDRLIESIIGLARRSERRPAPIRLLPWLQQTIAEYGDMRGDPPNIVIAGNPSDHVIYFDEGQLRQVLHNLWDNSDRHARREGAPTITLTLANSPRDVTTLSVADDGPGIPEALMDRVLEPFFTTADDGTGLGLHLAAEICQANGARLEPIAGQTGALFRIHFSHAGLETAAARPPDAPNRSPL